MNNYSRLEKILHKFALSSQLMREVTFDVESSLNSSKILNDNHLFIAGLARSGTTILLNAIYESNLFASLTYEDMPFVLAPNLWSKISLKNNKFEFKERAHGDGIKFSIKSPEAFEEVFWKTFDQNETETIDIFKIYINHIISKYQKKRYLSKNNQNIRRIDLLSESFPKSRIFIPFRDPIQHSHSLLNQHKKFIQYSNKDSFISKYMKLIGHTEFGPNYIPINNNNLIFENELDINHWIEQWCLTYMHCFQNLSNKENVNFICYEKLCTSKEYWLEILKKLDIEEIYDFDFKQSHKEINAKIDMQLIDKALSIYSKMSKLNFS